MFIGIETVQQGGCCQYNLLPTRKLFQILLLLLLLLLLLVSGSSYLPSVLWSSGCEIMQSGMWILPCQSNALQLQLPLQHRCCKSHSYPKKPKCESSLLLEQNIYIYIYIYIYVHVCVCVYVLFINIFIYLFIYLLFIYLEQFKTRPTYVFSVQVTPVPVT